MCGDLLLKFLKLYQKFRVLTERLTFIAIGSMLGGGVKLMGVLNDDKTKVIDQDKKF
jgi:hypothetical protein